MRDPNQKRRFNTAELSLMKSAFAGNDDLLYAIRKVMLQGELTESEEIMVKSMTAPMLAVVSKTFLPTIDLEAPLFQMSDMHLALQGELKLGVEQAWPYIQAKELQIAYIKQQLEILSGSEKKPKIILQDLSKISAKTPPEEAWVNLTTWNFLLSFVDTHIQQIKFLAGLKEETVEETLARLDKDSTK